MKKILFFTTLTLTLFSNFAMADAHHRQQKYLVCSKSLGAISDFSSKIDHCANITLDDGCYCGPRHQVLAMLEKPTLHDRRSNREIK